MAEGILFNVLQKLIGKVGSLVVEYWSMRGDLETLMENMTEIKAVVLDAEEQQGTNHQVQVWLDKLKDALDDADNLLDDFSTDDKKRQVMTKNCIKEVCIFFTSLLFSFKMASRVKDIGKRLEALNVEKRCLNLTNRNLEQRIAKLRKTHSFVPEEYVIGREKEKNHLVELLLNTNMDKKQNVSIISIVGIGGLGKTALAQLIYNDEAVQEHFELKMRVCVSDDFDVKTIAEKITNSQTSNEMDQVQQELRKKIEGKKYLLILDDIWNEDREHWLRLMILLMGGAKGSKIIITTRSKKVAEITGASSLFFLKSLDEKQAWKLFSQLAFENGEEPENKRLVSIGMDIVKKCSGVPLAIRSVGGLMYSMKTENDWLNFKDKDLVKIDEDGDNIVFQLIKLSYDQLPIHLKKCFAFCSLFPKDDMIHREVLIRLWMAQGFVESSNENICLEDVGNEHFMNLVHRSFFQDLRRHTVSEDIFACKMHDLMHDMAKSVSRNDCVIVTEQGQHIDKQTRHLSICFPLKSSWHVPSFLLMANKLRTFLLPRNYLEQSLDMSSCNLIVSSLEQLRVLGLNFVNIMMLPSCIDMLNHLRYLDLSRNDQIEVLPRSFTNLYNLQTLLLNRCSSLRELPSDLWKLLSLRHLELDYCNNLTYMPCGIGQLSYLQTLTMFVLDKKFKHSGGPSELGGLNHLGCRLKVKGLECLRGNPSEANDMNLIGKSHLNILTLTWESQVIPGDNDIDKDDLILQGILSHHIKSLLIEGFGGVTISGTINPFTNLIYMKLVGCMRLQSLPPFHLLLHLKSLILQYLPSLEWIDNNSCNDISSTYFPSLKIMEVWELHSLKGWCKCGEEGKPREYCWHRFETLDFFRITNCPNLISFPPHKNIKRVWLNTVNEKILHQAVCDSKMENLIIIRINGLKSLSKILPHFTTLRQLSILNCEELDLCNDENGCYSMQWSELLNLRWLDLNNIFKLEYLPDGLQHVTTLESLTIQGCVNLRCIPIWITLLRQHKIVNCPKLMSISVKVHQN